MNIWRYKYRVLVFTLAILGFSSTLAVIHDSQAKAIPSPSQWSAGNIISNNKFFDSSSMAPSAIQNFLNSKVPVCDTNGVEMHSSGQTRAAYGTSQGKPPPYTCLKDFTQSTPAMSADAYCGAYGGGVNNAATIIWNVSQICGINPQVLLVLLQKEQSLITDEWPWPRQYQFATGFCVYDVGPPPPSCSGTDGFFNQVYYAARQFKKYGANPQNYNFRANTTSNIQYNPNASCGSSAVHIQNQATANLYNYTPYQPNQGALNAGWGTASCGAYGNRNFWLYFWEWFGSPIGDLVSTGSGGVYKLEDGVKRAFPNEITFLSYQYKWANVTFMSSSQLAQIPDGAAMPYNVHFRNGHLVTSPTMGMYVVENGLKRPFPNEGTFYNYSFKFSDASVISNLEINLIPDGAAMPFNAHRWDGHLISSPTGGMYVVENGQKKPFASEITFLSYSYQFSDASVISFAEINLIPYGTAMPYNVHFRNGFLVRAPTGGMYVVDNGTKRPFPNEATFFSYGYNYSDALVISQIELNLIPDGAPMPPKS